MTKRVLIATGGTGGHIYPAIALAQQLSQEIADCEILFVGGGLEENRYFDRNSFAYTSISCGTFIKKTPKIIFQTLANIVKGVFQSRRIVKEFQPDVAVGFGSYYAFPPLIAALSMSVPLVLHEANSIPGKANRLLSRWASITGVHFPETLHLLKGKSIEVGLPLRNGFRRDSISSEQAKKHFDLSPNRKTLLIFGGSQGAKAINEVVREALFELAQTLDFQVLHIAGEPGMAEELKCAYAKKGIQGTVKAFEERMEIAWQAADLVICRSGAGTIAEQLEFEVPGILIPYPLAADNHQENNADFMVAIVGGAVKLREKGLVPSRLKSCLEEFLKNDGEFISATQKAMKNYKKKSRTRDLCSLVKDFF